MEAFTRALICFHKAYERMECADKYGKQTNKCENTTICKQSPELKCIVSKAVCEYDCELLRFAMNLPTFREKFVKLTVNISNLAIILNDHLSSVYLEK